MSFKKSIDNFGEWLEDKYWNIEPVKRCIVGWCVVILGTALIYFACYLLFLGGKTIYKFCQNSLITKNIVATAEEDNIVADEWSYRGRHREFPVTEKNPKRHIQLARDFNDINDVQLAAAQRLGVSPIGSREELDKVKGKLVELKDTKYYVLDNLTHSVPYLVPDAADFLTALGKLLQEYNGTRSRFVITSVLRTGRDVRSLSRNNVNASKNSCHCYGTTIDITYNRFDRHGQTNDIQLKADLARALYDLRKAGHCYVKYEYKQACFHITVRPR